MKINDKLVSDPKTEVKILIALAESNKPLYPYQISKRTNLSPQLVDYTIKKMVDSGLVLTIEDGKTYYYTHPCFSKGKNDILNIFNDLIKCLYSYTCETDNKEATLKNCIEMFLMMFIIDLNGN